MQFGKAENSKETDLFSQFLKTLSCFYNSTL